MSLAASGVQHHVTGAVPGRRGEALAVRKGLRLDRPGLGLSSGAVSPLGDIEDHGMGVELRRGVAIHRSRGVVFELRRDELTGGLGGMVAADPRLCVPLQLCKGSGDCGSVRFPHPLVPSNQGCQRDGLGRGEGRVPSGPVLDRLGLRAVRVRVLLRLPMPHQGSLGLRVFAFREPGELRHLHRSRQPELYSESSQPLALHSAVLFVVALRLLRKLHAVIRLRLAGAERLGDGQH